MGGFGSPLVWDLGSCSWIAHSVLRNPMFPFSLAPASCCLHRWLQCPTNLAMASQKATEATRHQQCVKGPIMFLQFVSILQQSLSPRGWTGLKSQRCFQRDPGPLQGNCHQGLLSAPFSSFHCSCSIQALTRLETFRRQGIQCPQALTSTYTLS